MHLRSVAAEESSGDSRKVILLLQHERNVVHRRIAECEARCVPSTADDTDGWLTPHLGGNLPPGAERAANRFPVFPRTRAVKRMELEQLESEPSMRKSV